MDLKLDSGNIITMVGWAVTFALGIISGGLIVPRFTKKRQILTWAVMNEAELIPRDLSEKLSIPVVLKVGDEAPTSLTSLTVRIGNSGNETINTATMAILMNPEARILDVRFASEAGEYENHVKWTKQGHRCDVTSTFINQNQQFELELLVGGYELGSLEVDAAMPGIDVKKVAASNWDAVVGSATNPTVLTLLGAIPGVKLSVLSEEARASALLAEVRSLRKAIARQNIQAPSSPTPTRRREN